MEITMDFQAKVKVSLGEYNTEDEKFVQGLIDNFSPKVLSKCTSK